VQAADLPQEFMDTFASEATATLRFTNFVLYYCIVRQPYHFGADFSCTLLQLVVILNNLYDILTGQLAFITETFKLF